MNFTNLLCNSLAHGKQVPGQFELHEYQAYQSTWQGHLKNNITKIKSVTKVVQPSPKHSSHIICITPRINPVLTNSRYLLLLMSLEFLVGISHKQNSTLFGLFCPVFSTGPVSPPVQSHDSLNLQFPWTPDLHLYLQLKYWMCKIPDLAYNFLWLLQLMYIGVDSIFWLLYSSGAAINMHTCIWLSALRGYRTRNAIFL